MQIQICNLFLVLSQILIYPKWHAPWRLMCQAQSTVPSKRVAKRGLHLASQTRRVRVINFRSTPYCVRTSPFQSPVWNIGELGYPSFGAMTARITKKRQTHHVVCDNGSLRHVRFPPNPKHRRLRRTWKTDGEDCWLSDTARNENVRDPPNNKVLNTHKKRVTIILWECCRSTRYGDHKNGTIFANPAVHHRSWNTGLEISVTSFQKRVMLKGNRNALSRFYEL